VKYALAVLEVIEMLFPERLCKVKLEDLLLKSEREVTRIARFFGAQPSKEVFEFFKYNTNKYQKSRYGNRINSSQVGLHKKWDTAFNGFFNGRGGDIVRIRRAFR